MSITTEIHMTQDYDPRMLDARHEAAHAVVFNMMGIGATDLVALEPEDRPDLCGVHRYHHSRPRLFEEQHQLLELHVMDYLHSAAGWLTECCLKPDLYEENGEPFWDAFLDSGVYGKELPDGVAAVKSLNAAAQILGLPKRGRKYYTKTMDREIKALAMSVMDPACWRVIETMAEDLHRKGRLTGDDVRRYQIPEWDAESNPARQLASRWVRRFHRWYPNPKITFLGWPD